LKSRGGVRLVRREGREVRATQIFHLAGLVGLRRLGLAGWRLLRASRARRPFSQTQHCSIAPLRPFVFTVLWFQKGDDSLRDAQHFSCIVSLRIRAQILIGRQRSKVLTSGEVPRCGSSTMFYTAITNYVYPQLDVQMVNAISFLLYMRCKPATEPF
jgi:hypothetical protein